MSVCGFFIHHLPASCLFGFISSLLFWEIRTIGKGVTRMPWAYWYLSSWSSNHVVPWYKGLLIGWLVVLLCVCCVDTDKTSVFWFSEDVMSLSPFCSKSSRSPDLLKNSLKIPWAQRAYLSQFRYRLKQWCVRCVAWRIGILIVVRDCLVGLFYESQTVCPNQCP